MPADLAAGVGAADFMEVAGASAVERVDSVAGAGITEVVGLVAMAVEDSVDMGEETTANLVAAVLAGVELAATEAADLVLAARDATGSVPEVWVRAA